MKYNAQNHLEDIQAELNALMMDLGMDPENMSNISFVDLKNSIKNTYAIGTTLDPNDPNIDNDPNLAIFLQRAKAVVNARKLIYIHKLVSGRI